MKVFVLTKVGVSALQVDSFKNLELGRRTKQSSTAASSIELTALSSVSLKPNTLINSSLLLEEAYNTAFIVVDSEEEPPSQEETVERYMKELSMAEKKLALAEKKICGACLAIELQIFL